MPKQFGPALRRARKGAGYTLEQLSKVLQISKTYLSDVERGSRLPLTPDKIAIATKTCNAKPGILKNLIALAARDRGEFIIPVTKDMNEDVLLALAEVVTHLGKSKRVGLRELRALFR